mgnify:CR=1 FL=1
MKLIWAHVDSPVEGVSELVTSCLEALLRAASRRKPQFVEFVERLLAALMSMPWNVKGKIRILTVIVAWVDVPQVM